LTVTDKPPFCLHGLNAVYLEDFGWYRIDARGNKTGVAAQFTPPQVFTRQGYHLEHNFGHGKKHLSSK
jgi:transglutaminase-like putative cysteine protease